MRQGSWWGPLAQDPELRGKLGGLLSNPPYIPPTRLETLQAEVRDHEPAEALDGREEDGGADLREIVEGAAEMLAGGGFVALETDGGEQAHAIARLLEGLRGSGGEAAFGHVAVRDDYSGVGRFVTAVRR